MRTPRNARPCPRPGDIEEEREEVFARVATGEVDITSPASTFNLYTDFELKAAARVHDASLPARRLAALRQGLATGETRFVDAAVTRFVRMNLLAVEPGSSEWQDLAEKIMRAQIEALERTIELDNGVFGGTPSDPLVRPPTRAKRVSMQGLFRDYISHARTIGNHRDGGKAWKPPIESLTRFLGHDDAHRITQSDLLRWRDALLAEGLTPKTVGGAAHATLRPHPAVQRQHDRRDQVGRLLAHVVDRGLGHVALARLNRVQRQQQRQRVLEFGSLDSTVAIQESGRSRIASSKPETHISHRSSPVSVFSSNNGSQTGRL